VRHQYVQIPRSFLLVLPIYFLFGLTLIFTIIPSAALSAAEGPLTIEPVEEAGLDADPRSIQMAVFSVTNNSSGVQNLEPVPALPEGWRTTSPLFPLELSPGETDMVYLGFIVPREALAGKYSVGFTAAAETHTGISGVSADSYTIVEASLPVTVRGYYSLSLQLVTLPALVIAGETYSVGFALTNGSNARSIISLEISGNQDIPLAFESTRITLGPGETREITIQAETPEALPKIISHAITVTAIMEEDGLGAGRKTPEGESVKASASSSVNVIPVKPGGDPWHRYPVTPSWNLSYSSLEEEQPLQNSLKLSGSGYIDDTGRHRLSFSIAPPAFPDPEWTIVDTAYSLNYTYKDNALELSGGTGSYAYPGLVQQSISGWGVRGTLDLGKTEIGSYAVFSTAEEGPAYGIGGRIKREFGEVNTIEMHYVMPETSFSEGLAGVKSFLRPYDAANISLEAALGFSGPEDYAYTLNAEEREDEYSYTFSFRQAGSDFSGPAVPGTYSYAASGSLSAFSGISLSGSIKEEKTNLELDAGQNTALLNRTTSLRTSFSLGDGISFKLSQQYFRQHNLIAVRLLTEQKEETAISIGLVFDDLRLDGSANLSRSYDFTSNRIASNQVFAVDAVYRPDDKLNITAKISFDAGSSPGITDALIGGSLGLSFQWGRDTNLSASLRTSVQPFREYSGSSTVTAGLRHSSDTLGNFSLNGSWTTFQNTNEGSFGITVSYARPFRIPTVLKSDVGTVSGFVYQNETGERLPGVIISIDGQTTITDSDGNFRFPAVIADLYYLQVNAAELGENYILAGTLPYEVEVAGKSEIVLEIPLTRPAHIEGRLIRMENDPSAGMFSPAAVYQEAGGFGGILVEISGDYGERREVTRSDGTFSFKGLVPGIWTITVYERGLPTTHDLEETTYTLELSPGETELLPIEVLPIQRAVKFLMEEIIEL